uniref:Rabaptin coiled-coil domain-containing protein n=1 Tax=Sinocyclocheilus grahami TaxID=75366 RepID=A0A672QXN0_SINGR
METIKAVATVSESTKQEAIDQVKQQWQEEVASLQAIMKVFIFHFISALLQLTKMF